MVRPFAVNIPLIAGSMAGKALSFMINFHSFAISTLPQLVYTEARISFEGNVMVSLEKVSGNSQGITAVKSRSSLGKDGVLQVKSQYQKDGKWIPGHEDYTTRNPRKIR